jgi:hypothetical protein
MGSNSPEILNKIEFISFCSFIILGCYFGISFFLLNDFRKTFNIANMKILFLLVALGIYLCSHILRVSRLYIIFIEKKVPFLNLLKIYVITTWVNFLVPFKIGEIFRITEYSKMCDSFRMGFISIWVERFFDAGILLLIVLFTMLFTREKFLVLFCILLGFVVFTLFVYISFPISYKYTNQIILSKSQSAKGVLLLEFIENIRQFYLFSEKLIRGRYAIIFSVSLLIWGLESLVFYYITKSLGTTFNLENMVSFLNQIYTNSSNKMSINLIYVFIGFIILSCGAIGCLLSYFPKRLTIFLTDLEKIKKCSSYQINYFIKK